MSHELSLLDAVDLVVADVRQSYPTLSTGNALRHALDTVTLADVYDDGDGDRLSDAYRLVLTTDWSPSRADLIELVRRLTVEGDVQLSFRQELWASQAAHHYLT